MLRYPHIVQFLGVCYLPGSRLPVLLMEKLMTSLDELLEKNKNIPLDIKVSILIDISRGLVYLHSSDPSIIHRDLSARNILLTTDMTAKIADLGVARMVIIQPGRAAATMTRAPGNIIYMPPEAVGREGTKYNTAIDMFSFGVVALFTLTEVFPDDLQAANYFDPTTRQLVARTEIERRIEYIQLLYRDLGETHPLVRLVVHCLNYLPEDRHSAMEVLERLKTIQSQVPQEWDMTKLELIRCIQQTRREVGTGEVGVEHERQLSEKQAEVDEKQEQIDQLQEDTLQKQLQLEQVSEDVLQKQQQIDQFRVDLYQKQAEIDEIQKQKELLYEDFSQEQQQVVQLGEGLTQKQQEIDQLQLSVSEKQQQIQGLLELTHLQQEQLEVQRAELCKSQSAASTRQTKKLSPSIKRTNIPSPEQLGEKLKPETNVYEEEPKSKKEQPAKPLESKIKDNEEEPKPKPKERLYVHQRLWRLFQKGQKDEPKPIQDVSKIGSKHS